MSEKFLTADDVIAVCEKHGWGKSSGTTGQALLSVDLDTVKSRSQIEDKLIEAGVLTGEKEFRPLVRENYPDGECPECGHAIPEDAAPGEECSSCGHVLWDTPEIEEPDTIEVIVGNIGTVYTGKPRDRDKAIKIYEEYVEQSKSGLGRAGGEEVCIMENGHPDPQHDYIPENYCDDGDDGDDSLTPAQAEQQHYERTTPLDVQSEDTEWLHRNGFDSNGNKIK